MASPGNIVVWEWKENNGQWIPYDPEDCCDIESNFLKNDAVRLGRSNPATAMYEIDFVKGWQRNTYSGKTRDIRQTHLPSSSALGMGVAWQWYRGSKRTGIWTTYTIEMIEFLEDAYSQQSKGIVDVPRSYNMPYTINLKEMTQKNRNTHYERDVRRKKLTYPYPKQQNSPGASGGVHPHSPTPMLNTMTNPAILRPQLPHLAAQFSNLTMSATYSHLSSSPPTPNTSNMSSRSQVPGGNSTSVVQGAAGPSQASTQSTTSKNKRGQHQFARGIALPPCPAGGIPCDRVGGTVPSATVLKNFTVATTVDPSSTEDCAICQMPLTEKSGFGGNLSSTNVCELMCKHAFHTECLRATYEHGVKNGCIVCPACNKMHGIKTGNQPFGNMFYSVLPSSLPGFGQVGTLRIRYDIKPGIQSTEHPHPGRSYRTPGFPRIAYLPDNDDGRKILTLLVEAWKRRLVFTVGQSSTLGQDDCVTWAGIHHKTEMQSRRGHGYPDAGYFERVLSELEAEGVTE